MIFNEIVHAEPAPGETVSPCCGLTLRQMPRSDWLSRIDAQVTCGTLTDRDIELLLGGSGETPAVAETAIAAPATEQFMFELTNRVRASCRPQRRCNYRATTTPVWR